MEIAPAAAAAASVHGVTPHSDPSSSAAALSAGPADGDDDDFDAEMTGAMASFFSSDFSLHPELLLHLPTFGQLTCRSRKPICSECCWRVAPSPPRLVHNLQPSEFALLRHAHGALRASGHISAAHALEKSSNLLFDLAYFRSLLSRAATVREAADYLLSFERPLMALQRNEYDFDRIRISVLFIHLMELLHIDIEEAADQQRAQSTESDAVAPAASHRASDDECKEAQSISSDGAPGLFASCMPNDLPRHWPTRGRCFLSNTLLPAIRELQAQVAKEEKSRADHGSAPMEVDDASVPAASSAAALSASAAAAPASPAAAGFSRFLSSTATACAMHINGARGALRLTRAEYDLHTHTCTSLLEDMLTRWPPTPLHHAELTIRQEPLGDDETNQKAANHTFVFSKDHTDQHMKLVSSSTSTTAPTNTVAASKREMAVNPPSAAASQSQVPATSSPILITLTDSDDDVDDIDDVDHTIVVQTVKPASASSSSAAGAISLPPPPTPPATPATAATTAPTTATLPTTGLILWSDAVSATLDLLPHAGVGKQNRHRMTSSMKLLLLHGWHPHTGNVMPTRQLAAAHSRAIDAIVNVRRKYPISESTDVANLYATAQLATAHGLAIATARWATNFRVAYADYRTFYSGISHAERAHHDLQPPIPQSEIDSAAEEATRTWKDSSAASPHAVASARSSSGMPPLMPIYAPALPVPPLVYAHAAPRPSSGFHDEGMDADDMFGDAAAAGTKGNTTAATRSAPAANSTSRILPAMSLTPAASSPSAATSATSPAAMLPPAAAASIESDHKQAINPHLHHARPHTAGKAARRNSMADPALPPLMPLTPIAAPRPTNTTASTPETSAKTSPAARATPIAHTNGDAARNARTTSLSPAASPKRTAPAAGMPHIEAATSNGPRDEPHSPGASSVSSHRSETSGPAKRSLLPHAQVEASPVRPATSAANAARRVTPTSSPHTAIAAAVATSSPRRGDSSPHRVKVVHTRSSQLIASPLPVSKNAAAAAATTAADGNKKRPRHTSPSDDESSDSGEMSHAQNGVVASPQAEGVRSSASPARAAKKLRLDDDSSATKRPESIFAKPLPAAAAAVDSEAASDEGEESSGNDSDSDADDSAPSTPKRTPAQRERAPVMRATHSSGGSRSDSSSSPAAATASTSRASASGNKNSSKPPSRAPHSKPSSAHTAPAPAAAAAARAAPKAASKAPAGPKQALAKPGTLPWECATCTWKNEPLHLMCSMCRAERPAN